ncbi:MAG TPA: peptidylprolyl isomerase [Bacteroidales bacterium]|nr:peptidylprolyl isomerase [Bacteroidales bacterium]
MKKVVTWMFFSAFLTVCLAQNNDPVLMNIAGKDVTKSEFEYIWNKNNSNAASDSKSLNDYVDLFINFKLKVAEAESQGIDTTQAFITELSGYRKQLITPYLTDKDAEEAMIKLCYDRIREYTELSHILLTVPNDASPEDTLKVYQKAMLLYKRALKGEDFAKLARENTEDEGSKAAGGYLGYSTGLRYVLPFENVAYSTPVGKVAPPVRTQFGYHIIKVINRVPAGGKYRSGHIMKAVAETATPEEKANAKDSIYLIYKALQAGEDFTKLATTQSDDRGAAGRGGEYGLMFCGSLPYEYESNVYKLKVGEYSAPFQSKYGWHIVKALEFQPYPPMEEMRNDLTGYIAQDEARTQVAKKSFIERIKKEDGYLLNKDSYNQFVNAYDLARTKGDTTLVNALSQSTNPLFVLDGKNFSQKGFAQALAKNKQVNNISVAFDNYVGEQVVAYEDQNLEKKYPEFGHLMQEYRDGILLFEISNREVWDKASQDTKGLEKFFKDSVGKYNWAKPHYKGFIISCANPDVAARAKKMIKKLAVDSVSIVLKRAFNTDSTSLIKVEQGLFSKGENATVDFLTFKGTKPESDKKYPVVFLSGKVLAKGPESYTDVRGLVISDYQNFLEESWIKSLRAKYKVIVNKEVLNTVNKN